VQLPSRRAVLLPRLRRRSVVDTARLRRPPASVLRPPHQDSVRPTAVALVRRRLPRASGLPRLPPALRRGSARRPRRLATARPTRPDSGRLRLLPGSDLRVGSGLRPLPPVGSGIPTAHLRPPRASGLRRDRIPTAHLRPPRVSGLRQVRMPTGLRPLPRVSGLPRRPPGGSDPRPLPRVSDPLRPLREVVSGLLLSPRGSVRPAVSGLLRLLRAADSGPRLPLPVAASGSPRLPLPVADSGPLRRLARRIKGAAPIRLPRRLLPVVASGLPRRLPVAASGLLRLLRLRRVGVSDRRVAWMNTGRQGTRRREASRPRRLLRNLRRRRPRRLLRRRPSSNRRIRRLRSEPTGAARSRASS